MAVDGDDKDDEAEVEESESFVIVCGKLKLLLVGFLDEMGVLHNGLSSNKDILNNSNNNNNNNNLKMK